MAATAGAVACGYFFFGDGPGATLGEPDREIPPLAVGTSEVRFELKNNTRHTVRVVGFALC